MRFQIWLAALLFLCGTAELCAQEPPCGVRTATETAQLVYPPIARAAHVTGLVILRAEFTKEGEVQKAEVWRGPEMLRAAALDFVKGLQANSYGGSRTCLISITFQMRDNLPEGANKQAMFVIDRSQGDFFQYVLVGKRQKSLQ